MLSCYIVLRYNQVAPPTNIRGLPIPNQLHPPVLEAPGMAREPHS